jgi:DNA-binding PadR family transcriptional regulator
LAEGALDALVLKVIALEQIHSCTIARRIRQMSCAGEMGVLYPRLQKLE